MAYIFSLNNNLIFYSISAILLDSREDFISASFNINPKQIIILNIFKNRDNFLTKWYKRLGHLGYKVLIKIIAIISGVIFLESKLIKMGFIALLND